MRYFRIYADERNIQPNILNLNSPLELNVRRKRIYEELGQRNYLNVKLDKEISFMDVISNPFFMVSKDFADLIRMYCPEMEFKHMILFDVRNRRAAFYQIPMIPEIDCLDEGSKWSRDGSMVIKGILYENRTGGAPIFRLKDTKGRCIMACLELVESAYRREVRGMGIEEFMVR